MPEERHYYDTMIKEYDLAGPHARRRQPHGGRLPPRRARHVPRALHLRHAQQGPAAGGGRREPQGRAAGVVHPVVRGHRGRRLQALRGQRLRARDRPGAGRPQVGGRARRRRRVGPLRHHRVDHPAALVRRQRRHGRALGLRRRAVEGRRPGAPGAQGHLPARRRRLLRRPRGLPRPAPGRRHPDDALPHRPVQQPAHAHRHAAGAAAAGRGGLAGGHAEPRLHDVREPVQHPHHARPAGPGRLLSPALPVRAPGDHRADRGDASRRSRSPS